MTTEEIKEGNRLIAEFMGWKYTNEGFPGYPHFTRGVEYWRTIENFHYHSDWNELMPVIIKIESMGYYVVIDGATCTIFSGNTGYVKIESTTKLTACYLAVCEFLKEEKR